MMALSSHVIGSSRVPQRNTVDSGPGFRFMSFDVVISSMDKYIQNVRRFVGIACVTLFRAGSFNIIRLNRAKVETK